MNLLNSFGPMLTVMKYIMQQWSWGWISKQAAQIQFFDTKYKADLVDWLQCSRKTSSQTCIISTCFSTIRCYPLTEPTIPSCLHTFHGRPRQVITHCLERKSNCQKYNEEDITIQDAVNGVFTVKGSSGKAHTVDFGKTSKPSCSCLDWIKWKIPCKHFFFWLVPESNGAGMPFHQVIIII